MLALPTLLVLASPVRIAKRLESAFPARRMPLVVISMEEKSPINLCVRRISESARPHSPVPTTPVAPPNPVWELIVKPTELASAVPLTLAEPSMEEKSLLNPIVFPLLVSVSVLALPTMIA